MADSEGAAIYRFRDGRLKPFITDGLIRPTGVAASPGARIIYVVDTGDHTVKFFDHDGFLVKTIPGQDTNSVSLHFPTFAAASASTRLFVNDALNYRIRSFDAEGNHLRSFGCEGDGPGCFARPKGIAIDSESHVYVVDNVFDNIQVFDTLGRLLLIIGSRGQGAGQFWSPAGIDISNDTIYVADTHNNRIQILRYYGGDQ
jgi:DNA-binding beta-propeller fold protein YncE